MAAIRAVRVLRERQAQARDEQAKLRAQACILPCPLFPVFPVNPCGGRGLIAPSKAPLDASARLPSARSRSPTVLLA